MYEILIQNGDTVYAPAVEEGIDWNTERKGSPGKLTFSCMADEILTVEEGDPVLMREDGVEIFYGFIFTIKRDKSKTISITAYDQLRYFKNKETYVIENKKASDVLKMVARDFMLNIGEVEDTYYTIPSLVEDNQELFDVVQNALDEELKNSGILYVLYDNCGKLCLKNYENMLVQILIDEETGENFDYQSSIDNDTYNQVKLFYDNEETGKREVYITRSGENINKWGLLQYSDSLKEGENGKAKADALLQLYNAKSKSLKLTNCAGDSRVRAGCCVVVKLNLGDVQIENIMLVEKCKHTYKNGLHTMDITVRGGAINSNE